MRTVNTLFVFRRMSKQRQLLEICSYHPEVLEKYRKKEFASFDFFAFNLNTQQTLQVTVQGDLLYLSHYQWYHH